MQGNIAQYQYDQLNRVSNITGARQATYRYDANGNRIEAVEDGQTTFTHQFGTDLLSIRQEATIHYPHVEHWWSV